jgi:hypothetical protein
VHIVKAEVGPCRANVGDPGVAGIAPRAPLEVVPREDNALTVEWADLAAQDCGEAMISLDKMENGREGS